MFQRLLPQWLEGRREGMLSLLQQLLKDFGGAKLQELGQSAALAALRKALPLVHQVPQHVAGLQEGRPSIGVVVDAEQRQGGQAGGTLQGPLGTEIQAAQHPPLGPIFLRPELVTEEDLRQRHDEHDTI